MPKTPLNVLAPKKSVLIFGLENVLIPAKETPKLDMKKVRAWLSALQKYQQTHPGVKMYLISGFRQALAWKKVKEYKLETFFPAENVFAVNESYLQGREEVDRQLYERKLADDPEARDEYFKQVKIQALMAENNWTTSPILLVGHDYWFDGFYTRRFSNVDVAFLEDSLTSRGKPAPEKVSGLWYISRAMKGLKPMLEGRAAIPNYGPLDAWVSITLTEELLGGKNLPQLKRAILERKKNGPGFDMTETTQPPFN